MSRVLSFRVDDELAAVVERVAGERGVKRGVLLEEAVRAHVSPVVVAPVAVQAARPVRVDSVREAQRWALQRQERLNKAKDRSK